VEASIKYPHKEQEIFTQLLLFVAKRARPDILLVVSFLTARVKEPDCDDWSKLL